VTALKRKVKRSIDTPSRQYVVALEPTADGGIISVREKGRKKSFGITVGSLYLILVSRAVEAERIAKGGRKRRAARVTHLRG